MNTENFCFDGQITRDELDFGVTVFYFWGMMRTVMCVLRNLDATVAIWESHTRYEQERDMTHFEFKPFCLLHKEFMVQIWYSQCMEENPVRQWQLCREGVRTDFHQWWKGQWAQVGRKEQQSNASNNKAGIIVFSMPGDILGVECVNSFNYHEAFDVRALYLISTSGDTVLQKG